MQNQNSARTESPREGGGTAARLRAISAAAWPPRLPPLWLGPLVGVGAALAWGRPTALWLLLGAALGYAAELAGALAVRDEPSRAGRALGRFLVAQPVLGVLALLALGGALPQRRDGALDLLVLLPIPAAAALIAAAGWRGGAAGRGEPGAPSHRWVGLAAGLLLVVALGVLDRWMPPPFALELLYLVPVFAVTWSAGRGAGVLTALFSAEVHGIARGLSFAGALPPLLSGLDSLLIFLGLAAEAVLLSAARAGIARETLAARTDLLTGLINRKAFLERMGGEIARAGRYGRPLSLAYLDLDGFKGVNDHAGHAAGDEVLRIVAGVLRTSLRAEDVPARLGGDEFAVLLPETDPETAALVVERLRLQVEDRMRSFDWPVTCSVGVVTSALPGATVEEMVRRADELMYEVKHGGKNSLRQAILSR